MKAGQPQELLDLALTRPFFTPYRRLRAYRKFHEAGVPFAIRDAAALVRNMEAGDEFEVEMPRWLFEAICDAIAVPASTGMGRNARPRLT